MFMRRFGKLLRRLKIGRFFDWFWFSLAKLRSPGKITADGLPYVDWPFRLDVKKTGSVHIGREVKFRTGFHGRVFDGAHLEIGDRTMFNTQAWLGVMARVTIGPDCLFGPRVSIVDSNHRFDDSDKRIWEQGAEASPLEIGDDVWVGAHCVVTKDIGDHSIIGAGAVVTKAIPAKSVAMGVPAKVVKSRESLDT